MRQERFNLSRLDSDDRSVIEAATKRLHELERRTGESIIEIGRTLIDVKDRIGHGHFGAWLDEEFGWSDRTARRFMSVAETFDQIGHGVRFEAKALYALASGNVPAEVREEFVAKAEAGERVTHRDVRQRLAVVDLESGELIERGDEELKTLNPVPTRTQPQRHPANPLAHPLSPRDQVRAEQEQSNRIMSLVGDPNGNVARASLRASFSKARSTVQRDLLSLDVDAVASTVAQKDGDSVRWFIRDTKEWLTRLESELKQGWRVVSKEHA